MKIRSVSALTLLVKAIWSVSFGLEMLCCLFDSIQSLGGDGAGIVSPVSE